MILDNENDNKKVHEWISLYTEAGKISNLRLVLGDIVNVDIKESRPLDLLDC